MKNILQALDKSSNRTAERTDDMRRFMSVVSTLNVFEQVQDMGDGVRKKINPDGSYEISDGGGTKYYNAQNQLIKTVGPRFAGVQNTTNTDGSASSSYQQGPLSVKQNRDAGGKVTATDSEYQLGADKLRQQRIADSVKESSTTSITSPVLNVDKNATPSMIGKYFKAVEQELEESKIRNKNKVYQLAEKVSNKLNGTRLKGNMSADKNVPK